MSGVVEFAFASDIFIESGRGGVDRVVGSDAVVQVAESDVVDGAIVGRGKSAEDAEGGAESRP